MSFYHNRKCGRPPPPPPPRRYTTHEKFGGTHGSSLAIQLVPLTCMVGFFKCGAWVQKAKSSFSTWPKVKVCNKLEFSNLKDRIPAVLYKNSKLLPGLGERGVKVSRNITDTCKYFNFFFCVFMFDVCVSLCMVFACDVSGTVPVYWGEKRYCGLCIEPI